MRAMGTLRRIIGYVFAVATIVGVWVGPVLTIAAPWWLFPVLVVVCVTVIAWVYLILWLLQ